MAPPAVGDEENLQAFQALRCMGRTQCLPPTARAAHSGLAGVRSACVDGCSASSAPGTMTGVHPPTAAELLNALQRAKGTVTEFLEHLAGEPIDADILSQKTGPAGNDNSLGLESDAELIRRIVLLTGRISGRRFVYAESAIAAERLPPSARRCLESSRDPIGRVLTKYRLEVQREPLAGPVVAVGNTARTIDLLDSASLSRRYRITLGSDPVIVVSEWFLQTVPEALTSRTASSVDPLDSSSR